jgi:hypothetical protein
MLQIMQQYILTFLCPVELMVAVMCCETSSAETFKYGLSALL